MIRRCLAAASLLALAACGAPDDEVARAAIRAADIADVNNLMSLHSWYHAAFRNGEELQKIWSKRDDIIWAQNVGYWKGMASISRYYGAEAPASAKAGGFVWHTVTSGVVEVAGDRQTAKGVWYTPGIGGQLLEGNKGHAGWMWEKYAVDFVREEGHWKIWHLKVYTDFSVDVGSPMGAGGGMGPPPKAEKVGATETKAAPAAGNGMPGPNPDYTYKKPYREWRPGVEPQLVPRPPQPYQTFGETWSYADEGE